MAAEENTSRVDSAIAAEQVRILYRQQPLSLSATLLVAVVATSVLVDSPDQFKVTAWLGTVVLLTVIRFVNMFMFQRRYVSDAEIRPWRIRAVTFAFLSGINWAALPIMFISGQEPFTIINITILSSGMLAGSLASQCVHLPALLGFSVPLMIGLSGSVHVYGGEYSNYAWLGYVFSIVMLGFARNANRVFRRSIATRFENARLIEELREQKAEADAANLAKSQFLAAASHDLRQPLHAVGLYAGALHDTATTDQQQQLNGKMSRAIESLDQLLGHILEVSKLDAGVVEPAITDFRIGDVFERLDLRYRPTAEGRGLDYRSSGHELLARSDRVLLERILDNLLANASRFTQSGHIELLAEQDAGQLIVSVRDTGNGIPADEHKKVFQEFYQIENPERDRSKGLGLGLSIVQRLCTLLGHDLQLESASGNGSCFRIVVPQGVAEHLASEAGDGSHTAPELSGKHILVIDDEQEVRDATAEQLRSWGCEVRAAGSLEEATEPPAAPLPDLLIADYRLRGGASGIDAIVAYRNQFGEHIPALLVTGDTAPERIREAVDSGVTVLHKPVSPGKLRMCVSQMTSRMTRGGDTSPARTAR